MRLRGLRVPEDQSQEGWTAHFAKKSEAEATGKKVNGEKMTGFYVDLEGEGGAVPSPANVSTGTIDADLQTAAQVVEMLLLRTTAG